ncbi:DUF642 domain-containing protein [Roseateles sp. SL47]|jgi:Protein of unknown function (DUF642)/PEP-CTERM motif|uniref:DUF642 domain-containing protein n=1 Tax=Roseateles sp. SL47 TaxID=2995138 RepID=UPI00226E9CA3|nr:DUF642 domain-containing protein [Roseateles sp. SL47]WAC72965.1 DUF642 domain-containing protein [Roseateles sp. SL47]
MKRLIAATLIALPLAGFAATDDNLLVNGSFESNVLRNGTWANFGSIDGWTVGNKGVEVRDNISGSALDGQNFVELDSTGNSSISQSFATVAGYTYELSFSYANRPDNRGAASNGISWSVGSLSGTVGQNTSTSWATYTTTFVGTGDVMTLSFAGIGRSDSYGTSLDNVSVSVISTVPEPQSYALMLAGLGTVTLLSRRRRRNT